MTIKTNGVCMGGLVNVVSIKVNLYQDMHEVKQ